MVFDLSKQIKIDPPIDPAVQRQRDLEALPSYQSEYDNAAPADKPALGRELQRRKDALGITDSTAPPVKELFDLSKQIKIDAPTKTIGTKGGPATVPTEPSTVVGIGETVANMVSGGVATVLGHLGALGAAANRDYKPTNQRGQVVPSTVPATPTTLP